MTLHNFERFYHVFLTIHIACIYGIISTLPQSLLIDSKEAISLALIDINLGEPHPATYSPNNPLLSLMCWC